MAYIAKFRGGDLATAIALAGAESDFYAGAHCCNCNGPLEDSYGLWQINKNSHPTDFSYPRILTDAQYAADSAFQVRNYPNGWYAWSTYRGTRYNSYLERAQAAASTAEASQCGAAPPTSTLSLIDSAYTVCAEEGFDENTTQAFILRVQADREDGRSFSTVLYDDIGDCDFDCFQMFLPDNLFCDSQCEASYNTCFNQCNNCHSVVTNAVYGIYDNLSVQPQFADAFTTCAEEGYAQNTTSAFLLRVHADREVGRTLSTVLYDDIGDCDFDCFQTFLLDNGNCDAQCEASYNTCFNHCKNCRSAVINAVYLP